MILAGFAPFRCASQIELQMEDGAFVKDTNQRKPAVADAQVAYSSDGWSYRWFGCSVHRGKSSFGAADSSV